MLTEERRLNCKFCIFFIKTCLNPADEKCSAILEEGNQCESIITQFFDYLNKKDVLLVIYTLYFVNITK